MGIPRKQTMSVQHASPPTPQPVPIRARYFVSYIHSEEDKWGAGNAVLTLNPGALVQSLIDITVYIEAEYGLTKISIINFQKINEDDWLPEPEVK